MKKYAYNLKVLDEWSPSLAYIIGLALTDGTIHKNMARVSFYSSDLQMLEIVKQFFESTRLVELHGSPDKNVVLTNGTPYVGKKQMYVFHVDSMRATQRFCQLGVMPNKSYTGEYPQVAQEVWWHYFRGIFDGDGNIFFSRRHGLRITIAGNKNCVVGLYSDLSQKFSLCSHMKYLDKDRVKLLFLYGEFAEKALVQMYQESDHLRLERKYIQWLEWKDYGKLTTSCLLCDVSIRSSQGQKLCHECQVIRNRLMNRRSDHYKRNGIWLPLRELCKPEESHFPVERLDRYVSGSALWTTERETQNRKDRPGTGGSRCS